MSVTEETSTWNVMEFRRWIEAKEHKSPPILYGSKLKDSK